MSTKNCFLCLFPSDGCLPLCGEGSLWRSTGSLLTSRLAERALMALLNATDVRRGFLCFFSAAPEFPRWSLYTTLYYNNNRVARARVYGYNIIRVHDAFHRRFPGPLPVITPFIRMENPRRRRFLSCSPLLFPSVRPSKKGQNSPFFHVLLSLHPKI